MIGLKQLRRRIQHAKPGPIGKAQTLKMHTVRSPTKDVHAFVNKNHRLATIDRIVHRIAPRTEPRMAPRIAPCTEPRIAPRTEPRIAPRTEPRIAPRTEPRIAPRTEPRIVPRTASRPTGDALDPRVRMDPPPLEHVAKPRVTVFVQWYATKSPLRMLELLYCANGLLRNTNVDHIVFFVPVQDMPSVPEAFMHRSTGTAEIVLLPDGGRLKYTDALSRSTDPNTVYIVMNSDIAMPAVAVRRIADILGVAAPARSICLSRWESSLSADPLTVGYDPRAVLMKNPRVTQDVWAFRGGPHITKLNPDFPLGLPGCDNKIAWWLMHSTVVINPCTIIRTYHIHTSNLRSYTDKDRLARPYGFVSPT
jgi:hypothetical protein